MTEDRRIKWERTLEWPLTLAAVLFLVAYAVPILRPDVDPSLPGSTSGLRMGTA